MKNIIAIHAHPDDVEFLAAGTLALLKDKGCNIHIATMSPGDKGSPDRERDEIAAIRREEAKQSAALLGAEYTCIELADFEIFDNDFSRRTVTEFIRQRRPDIILAASPQDYLIDHELASTLTRNAAFFAGVRLYETGVEEPMDSIPALYYMDPIEGKDIFGQPVTPDFCVDIAAKIEIKEQMLACHASQRDWLKQHHGVDRYIEAMREWSAQRGGKFGVAFGEGFRQHRGHAYPQDNVLMEIIPEAIKLRM